VVAPNISPDERHGIGGWSYAAFTRAMRQGIGRDGTHLYPVHPYTSFTHASDGDLQDLYAYLMNTPASTAPSQASALRFPFNIRRLMAGWNTLYLGRSTIDYTPEKGEAWNRGAYLVEGLGHCSACHSPRNALGAEETGKAYLAGGFADGWQAPALTALSPSPLGWTSDALYDYLRNGHSADHGSASGPMAAVVQQLSALPDADIQAMATYLGSLQPRPQTEPAIARSAVIAGSDAAATQAALAFPEGARLFEGACSSCHEGDTGLAHLSLNSNLHGTRPDNLIQAILNGVEAPASLRAKPGADEEAMSMPAFRDSFSDRQIGQLSAYLRARFAPGKPAWPEAAAMARGIRGSSAGP
jgi:nicotinate dehydrogenase subunit B